ncbi:MAG: LLM class flavin-dependent oxidoreductase [Nocardioides sp.]|nr:LLM class flavin-dependent oxidoreductase [Nocardioides sp.]
MDIGIACAFVPTEGATLGTAIATAAAAAEDGGFASWWGMGDREVARTASHDQILGLYCVARATQRIRLGLAGDALSVRPAAVRAKQLASLDWFANGRLELGLDLDTPPLEISEPGVECADPVGSTLDRLGAMETLWTERRGAYRSNTVSFAGAIAHPKTVGARRLRTHARHTSAPLLRRFVESRGEIDGWAAWKLEPAALIGALEEIAQALPSGHGPVRRTWFVDAPLVQASRARAAEAGIDELVAVFDRVPHPAELQEAIA